MCGLDAVFLLGEISACSSSVSGLLFDEMAVCTLCCLSSLIFWQGYSPPADPDGFHPFNSSQNGFHDLGLKMQQQK